MASELVSAAPVAVFGGVLACVVQKKADEACELRLKRRDAYVKFVQTLPDAAMGDVMPYGGQGQSARGRFG